MGQINCMSNLDGASFPVPPPPSLPFVYKARQDLVAFFTRMSENGKHFQNKLAVFHVLFNYLHTCLIVLQVGGSEARAWE